MRWASAFALAFASFSHGGEDPGGVPEAAIFEVARVNACAVQSSEVEALFRETLLPIEERFARGRMDAGERLAGLKKAWKEAIDQTVQDVLLFFEAEKVREEIQLAVVAAAQRRNAARNHEQHPELVREKAQQYFARIEADEVRRVAREYVQHAGGEEALQRILQRRGQNREDWENKLRRDLFIAYFLSYHLGPMVESPREVREYYRTHPDEFAENETWRLRRIAILKAKYSTPEVAREAARLVRDRVAGGADFEQVAAKIGEDETAKDGGLLSHQGSFDVPAESYPREIALAAKLKPGEISETYEDARGFYLLKLEAHTPAKRMSFEEAQGRASALVRAELLRKRRTEMFDKLKSRALIRILVPEPPARFLEAPKPSPLRPK